MVSAVPTACGGTDSVTSALNCAESATTKNPQTRAITSNGASECPNTRGVRTAHEPLAIMATVTSHSRPCRSADNPPQTLPMPPIAIARKATTETVPDETVAMDLAPRLAAVNAGIHVQNEYNSNMCPR